MAIEIKKHTRKDGTLSWYVVITEGSKRTYIKKASLVAAGFSPNLSYDEAKSRATQLNAQGKLKLQAARRAKIAERLDTERLEALAFLPMTDIHEFENKILAPKFLSVDVWDPKHKLAVKWRAAIKTMGAVKLDPSEWAEKPFLFYNYFLTKMFSTGYVERIIAMMNLYGYFYCRKYAKAFCPIPPLKGIQRQKQINAYSKNPHRRHKAERITPSELEAQRGNLGEELYNWIFLSLWLGLRPEEVDALKNPLPSYGHFFELKDDCKIIVVYQSKLKNSVEEEDRWKRIPILYPEQERALEIIESGKFHRPLPQTMQLHLGKKHADTYSGRKSFTDLMLGFGQRLEDIQGWMGHTTIERTWKDYKSRKVVHFIKPPKKAG